MDLCQHFLMKALDLNNLFSNNSSEEFESACVHNLKKGLDCLGLIKVNDDKLCGICCLLHQTHISNKNLYTYYHKFYKKKVTYVW